MKSVELKLVVEDIGEYSLSGKIENNSGKVVGWSKYGSNQEISTLEAFHEILMPSKNVNEARDDLLNCGCILYSTKDISITIKYKR